MNRARWRSRLLAAGCILLGGCGSQAATRTVTTTASAAGSATVFGTGTTLATTASGLTTSATSSSSTGRQLTKCDNGVMAGAETTSCAFAENVFNAVQTGFESAESVPAQVTAFSPVTNKTYALACSIQTSTVTCTDSTGSLVQFPQSNLGPAQSATSTSPAVPTSSTVSSTTPSGSSEGPGSLSHAGDSQFCSTHECIENFPNGNGYVVQCVDGEWSHSGGLSGACSDHGGES
jgi:hypothetical protein